MDFNQVTLTGNITADAKLLKISSDKYALNFTVACNMGTRSNGNDDVYFFDCSLYNNIALSLEQYLKRGKEVALSGTLKMNFYLDKKGAKKKHSYVNVENIKLASSINAYKEENNENSRNNK